jgi:hypothetical protein
MTSLSEVPKIYRQVAYKNQVLINSSKSNDERSLYLEYQKIFQGAMDLNPFDNLEARDILNKVSARILADYETRID